MKNELDTDRYIISILDGRTSSSTFLIIYEKEPTGKVYNRCTVSSICFKTIFTEELKSFIKEENISAEHLLTIMKVNSMTVDIDTNNLLISFMGEGYGK